VAYLAQRTDKATITRRLRCSWQAVAAVVTRVVAGHLDGTRLEGLDRIGIDEVSDRKGHRYLTVVADHDRDGAVVWPVGHAQRHAGALLRHLGAARTARLQAASMDLHGAVAKVTRARAPRARCAPTLPHRQAGQPRPWTRSAGPPGTAPAAPRAWPVPDRWPGHGQDPPRSWSRTPAGRC
jgi:transposase